MPPAPVLVAIGPDSREVHTAVMVAVAPASGEMRVPGFPPKKP